MRNSLGGTLNVALDRTQEVGGSNPPSSIDSNLLQTRRFAFRALVLTTLLIPATFGH
jgi:hypothetical protein